MIKLNSDKVNKQITYEEIIPTMHNDIKSLPENWKFVANKLKESENKAENILRIYAVTWNLKGEVCTDEELRLLLSKTNKRISKDKYYHIYAIGTQECMRSIFSSFFNSSKDEWLSMIQ